ncbi:MAG: hypothetical protein J2P31_12280 [Blastocatellia bacterium]|nr:hypothetical protein [Blastocatellia bacterium]
MTLLTFTLCLLSSTIGAAQDDTATDKSGSPPPTVFSLTDDITTLPIVMVREFPFVPATINGVSGKLMFDTGNEKALSLNDHKVPLKDGKVVGKGIFGSGQKYEVKSYPEVASVDLAGGTSYRNISGARGYDLSFIEKDVTPDFLGFIGYEFYRGYLFKLDYKGNRITFYRQTDDRRESKDYLAGENVIAAVSFITRKQPNHPVASLKIGGVDFLGTFDTGTYGAAYMTRGAQARLIEQNLLLPLPNMGDNFYQISGIRLTPEIEAAVSGIPVFNYSPPSATAMGTPEPDIIQFGYALLRQYKTVWDFREGEIYLLKQ